MNGRVPKRDPRSWSREPHARRAARLTSIAGHEPEPADVGRSPREMPRMLAGYEPLAEALREMGAR